MRAQISSEFAFVLATLLLLFLPLFVISAGSSINLLQAQDSVAALRNAYAVSAAINYVYLAGDGAAYSFTLKNAPAEENITITAHAVTSERPRASASAALLTGSVNASSVDGNSLAITNDGGVINIAK